MATAGKAARLRVDVTGAAVLRAHSMSAIVLHRIDPVTDMSRFYRFDVQNDLFGQSCFVREG